MLKAALNTILVLGVLCTILVTCLAGTGLSPYRMAAVQTGSMSPTLPSKTLLIIKNGQSEEGQAVAFRHHGDVITHRWVRTNPNGTLVTKGDANSTEDPWEIPASQVIGGVAHSIPGLGFWLIYLQRPLTWGFLLTAALCLMLLWPRPSSSEQPEEVDEADALVQAT